MAKAEKPSAAEPAVATPRKSNKKLILVISLTVLLIGGGVAAFLLMKPGHPAKPDEAEVVEEETQQEVPPSYVQLGTFTANLIHEEGDRYLQVAIELKVTRPELKDKIKATNPEILHRVNMLLQSKRPSELATFDGKQKLAEQIKAQVEYVLGLRKTAPTITDSDSTSNKAEHAVQTAAQSSPAATPAETPDSGITDVLFTSFIIQ